MSKPVPPRPVYATVYGLTAVVGTAVTLSTGEVHVHLTHVPSSGTLVVCAPEQAVAQ